MKSISKMFNWGLIQSQVEFAEDENEDEDEAEEVKLMMM